MRRSHNTILLLSALLTLGVASAVLVTVTAYVYVAPQLPDVEALKAIQLEAPMRVYSRDGRLLAEFGEKRRIPVAYDQIPAQVIDAFVAAEDDRYFQHPGVDYQGLLRAAWMLLVTGEKRQGGSTITMQVARNFLLTSEKTIVRKVREIFLALRIERALTKEEILTLYLNKIFLGHRAYGVAAAAEVYYGKSLQALTLAEIATLAGLPKAPSSDNPVTSPERARARRSYVLRRMLELGVIDETAYQAASEAPVAASVHGPTVQQEAAYLAEMVRAEMLERFGRPAYYAGYKVTTTLDSRLQASAVRSVREALRAYDERHGYRGPLDQRDDWMAAESAGDPAALLEEYPRVPGLSLGLVTEADAEQAQVYVRGTGSIVLTLDGIAWARRHISEDIVGSPLKEVSAVLAAGDVIYVRPVDGGWRLAQVPRVQGALVAMDPQDDAVVALVGGYDFQGSKFNRAVQARRQPGSSFKPFIYSAALEDGFTAASLIPDSPVVFQDSGLETEWRPENYSREFQGLMRLREALVKSRNLVSVRVLQTMGVGYAHRYLQRFGFSAEELPRNLSLALGSASLTPMQMATAYAVLASGGYRTAPYFIQRIEAADGSVVFEADPLVVCRECFELESLGEPREPPDDGSQGRGDFAASRARARGPGERAPEPYDECSQREGYLAGHPGERLAPQVISRQNAYLITDMMIDVIRRGTGRSASELGREDLAGKTGTTNDYKDAWFSGFNADLVASAWVGFDDFRPLGRGEVGGRAALPAWKAFMGQALAGVPNHRLPQPDGLVRVKISPSTGLLANASDPDWIYETFRVGQVPRGSVATQAQLPGEVTDEEDQEEPLF